MHVHNSNSLGINREQETKKESANSSFTLFFAVGIILMLGGIFVLIASYKVLPQGANILSNMGIWELVAGYSSLGFGLIILAITSYDRCRATTPLSKKEPEEEIPLQKKTKVRPTATINNEPISPESDNQTKIDEISVQQEESYPEFPMTELEPISGDKDIQEEELPQPQKIKYRVVFKTDVEKHDSDSVTTDSSCTDTEENMEADSDTSL